MHSICTSQLTRRVVLVLACSLTSCQSGQQAMPCGTLPLQHWKSAHGDGRQKPVDPIWSSESYLIWSSSDLWNKYLEHPHYAQWAADLQPVCIFPGSRWTVWTLESELRISSCSICSCESKLFNILNWYFFQLRPMCCCIQILRWWQDSLLWGSTVTKVYSCTSIYCLTLLFFNTLWMPCTWTAAGHSIYRAPQISAPD